MADILIDTSPGANTFNAGQDQGIFWTGVNDGYYFFIEEVSDDLMYAKTTNSGLSFAAAVQITANNVQRFAVWYDRFTANDTGSLFHIAHMANQNAALEYNQLDSSDDSLSTALGLASTASLDVLTDWRTCGVSITKARGGNIHVAEVARNDTANLFRRSHFRSTDGGSSFGARADFFENTGDAANTDRCILMPGNGADNQDIMGVYYDDSATELSMKVYDDSANTISETLIDADINVTTGGDMGPGYSAVPRHSDGLILAIATSLQNAATGDCRAYELDPSVPSVTALTDVYTDENNHHLDCALHIDQNNDTLRAVVLGAPGETPFTAVNVYYHESTDGGTTWGSRVKVNEDAADIHRCCSTGVSVGSDGGRFQPTWTEDDLAGLVDQYFTNNNTSIAIGGSASPVAISAQVAMQQRELLLV